MRQQRQTLQQPNAWQRYYDPNRTSPATVTPPAITVAPNWFPDPRGEKRLRYWDGQQWTEHTTE
jgi:hypothetical protein